MGSNWCSEDGATPISVLAGAADRYADRIFLDFSGETVTYAEVFAQVCGLARGLRDLGVKHGDTVVLMLDNNLDNILTWFAVTALGAVSVPINSAYKGEFLRHQVSDSQARVAIVESSYLDRFAAIAPRLEKPPLIVVRGGAEAGREPTALATLQTGDPTPLDIPQHPSELNSIFYTAGTTGMSKGCMVSHTFVHTMARTSLIAQSRRSDEPIWTPLPMFHLNAVTMSVLSSAMIGGRAGIAPHFSVSNFWPEVVRSDARIVSMLGSMVSMIALMDDTAEMKVAKGQLRVAFAVPFPPDIQRIWQDRFGVAFAGGPVYGQTETGFAVSASIEDPAPPGSSGRRNDLLDMIIVDENDHELPPGQVGEIIVRPKRPHVLFDGYWRRPDYTVGVWRNLWYHTGDLGKFDEDGWFYFADRKQDYLRRRGENISSFEVEASLRQHPDVAEVAVVGVPSEVSEDDLKAVVVLRNGAALTEAQLFHWSVDHVPFFALPRYIEFTDALPKSQVGRVFKHQLRTDGVTAGAWDRVAAGVVVKRG